MRKCPILWKIAAMIIVITALFSLAYTLSNDEKAHITVVEYEDVTGSEWYLEAVETLVHGKIIDGKGKFDGASNVNGYQALEYLYSLSNSLGIKACEDDKVKTKETDKILLWAQLTGITKPLEISGFDSKKDITKEEVCVLLAEFMNYAQIKAPVRSKALPFKDTLAVSDLSSRHVAALKMAGISGGNQKGMFNPKKVVSRAELAQMISYIYGISFNQAEEGKAFVDMESKSFAKWYKQYMNIAVESHEPLIKESKPVELDYFDDAVFIGDSVTMSLQYYCAATGSLGKAGFLCAASQSAASAYITVTGGSIDPRYHGSSVLVEDGVALMGAKKVYIMLGINSLFFVDQTVTDVFNLSRRILAKNPEAKIILQSVTPTTENSPLKRKRMKIDNELITGYNKKLYKMAKENGWYYLNVAEAVSDEKGNLKEEYCSDPATMGIHFTYEADQAWVDYLKTHPLKAE